MLFSKEQVQGLPHVLTPEEVRAEQYLTIPALIIPEIKDDNQESLEQHWDRLIATRLFVTEQIDIDDYLDILNYSGVNVGNVVDFWEQGISLSSNFKGI